MQDGKQYIVLFGSSSKRLKLFSGVLQDVVMGPLFCLVYTRDTDEVAASKMHEFAVDRKLFGVFANQLDLGRMQINSKSWYSLS